MPTRMQRVDNRREARGHPGPSGIGELTLTVARSGLCARVEEIRNLSDSGICLVTGTPFQPGQLVSIAFGRDGIRTEFYGAVAWCDPADDPVDAGDTGTPMGERFAVGLHLRGPISLASMLNWVVTGEEVNAPL